MSFSLFGQIVSKAVLGISQSKVLRVILGRPYVTINILIWTRLPAAWKSKPFIWSYGSHVHSLIQLRGRSQSTGTYFLRNRPELKLLLQILESFPKATTVDIAILGCSKGAEVYSFSYAIRTARPDLRLHLSAMDIDREALEFAKGSVYSIGSENEPSNTNPFSHESGRDVAAKTSRDQPPSSSMFERMSPAEMEAMFERQGIWARVRPQFSDGVRWHIGDAGNPSLAKDFGLQDIVVANRFLCHMHPRDAETCLRNLAQLVKRGGYLFVSGVDLAVRSKIASECGWRPVVDLIEEVHEGDQSMRHGWPLEYWGLEPLDRSRKDWKLRYASVFKLP